MPTHTGGCHCGAVRFEFEAPADVEVHECNCSICGKLGFLHWIVPHENFRLLQGEDALATYSFHTATAKHLFCSHCGVKSFYVPRSHPEDYSVNQRCVDPSTLGKVSVAPFDGERWEEAIASLRS